MRTFVPVPSLFIHCRVLLWCAVVWISVTANLRAADSEITATMEENAYTVSGTGWDPTLTLIRGRTYTFTVNACDCHPVIIVGAPLDAVDNNNTYSGIITFRVPITAANYAYRCSIHHFGGAIQTIPPPPPAIRLTGPSCLRAATHTAMTNILSPGFTFAWTGPSLASANQAIFTGTTVGPVNAPVTFKTHWGGSLGGLKSLTQNAALANAWLTDNTPQSVAGSANAPANYEPATAADIALTDCFQSSTPFRQPVLVDRVVGVIPYQWVRNFGSPAALDNLTLFQASNLLSGGILLSQFTAAPADNSTVVLCTGRDEDAGVRVAAFAEAVFGINSNPTQYRVNLTGSPATVQSIEIWPPTSVLGLNYPSGHSGEAVGTLLAAKLSAPGSSTVAGEHQGWLVSYAPVIEAAGIVQGPSAAATSVLAGTSVSSVTLTSGGSGYGSGTTVNFTGGGGTGAAAKPVITNGVNTQVIMTAGGTGYTSPPAVSFRSGAAMKWNGFDYSPAAVREGQYTFWSYQHLCYRPGSPAAAVANQLAARLKSNEAALTGILLSTMNVGRFTEGGDVTPGNPYP